MAGVNSDFLDWARLLASDLSPSIALHGCRRVVIEAEREDNLPFSIFDPKTFIADNALVWKTWVMEKQVTPLHRRSILPIHMRFDGSGW